jgi:hypothetical protein
MPPRITIWHGTEAEAHALVLALSRNCDCAGDRICPAHTMLGDQSVIDYLLFMRHIAEILRLQEQCEWDAP